MVYNITDLLFLLVFFANLLCSIHVIFSGNFYSSSSASSLVGHHQISRFWLKKSHNKITFIPLMTIQEAVVVVVVAFLCEIVVFPSIHFYQVFSQDKRSNYSLFEIWYIHGWTQDGCQSEDDWCQKLVSQKKRLHYSEIHVQIF